MTTLVLPSEKTLEAIRELFMAKVEFVETGATGPCWRWTGSVTAQNAPVFRARSLGVTMQAHRAAWRLWRESAEGPVTELQELRMTCDAPFKCVNPHHRNRQMRAERSIPTRTRMLQQVNDLLDTLGNREFRFASFDGHVKAIIYTTYTDHNADLTPWDESGAGISAGLIAEGDLEGAYDLARNLRDEAPTRAVPATILAFTPRN